MSRPKVGVTLNNFIAVRIYFKSALKDGRLWDSSAVLDDDFINNAERAFKTVFLRDEKIDHNDKTNVKEYHLKSCAALQSWIDNFVPKEKWERCLKTLRQQKRRKKYTMRRLDLPEDIYISLKILAEQLQLNLAETVQKAVQTELDKFCDKELKE